MVYIYTEKTKLHRRLELRPSHTAGSVLEVSAHDWLALLLLGYSSTKQWLCEAEEVCSPQGWEAKEDKANIPFKDIDPNDLTSSHLAPPTSYNAMGSKTKPLTHWPVEEI
jgi:hypothetical protein